MSETDIEGLELRDVLAYFRHQVETDQDLMLTNHEARLILKEIDRLRREELV